MISMPARIESPVCENCRRGSHSRCAIRYSLPLSKDPWCQCPECRSFERSLLSTVRAKYMHVDRLEARREVLVSTLSAAIERDDWMAVSQLAHKLSALDGEVAGLVATIHGVFDTSLFPARRREINEANGVEWRRDY